MNETEVRERRISPALTRAGWDLERQVRCEVTFTAGAVIVRGKKALGRGEKKRADYLLFWKKHLPLAVLEAKDSSYPLGGGMQQAIGYAEALDLPFAISSNGDGFLFRDLTGGTPAEKEMRLDEFPAPEELWRRYREWKGLDESTTEVVEEPYFEEVSGKTPRYYQRVAINRTVQAIAQGQRRILLVMATGTGKTYTAFQIIWRLWKKGRAKRILFLADRNILVDQAKTNDFKPFGGAMTKVQNRQIDKSYEIYLALYQAVTGSEDEKNIYRQFSPDFFDLVVIDECHRSSAREASAWHEILDYFESATHIGLTATPKETHDVSNMSYFGEPVYTYSLKQGIQDGFLAPYKVVRIDLDRDLQGWRPEHAQLDDLGHEIEDRIYNQKDFDRQLVLRERTKLVAQKIIELLEATDPYGKTIVFCEDIEHAERMRSALVNASPVRSAEDSRYVVRITGDNPEGKAQLDHFIHPEERYPVIATTSKLLSTGVDAKTCQLVVLDQRIQSMTEFKQIIGRGTRIHEETGKLFFTILDFKKVTELFADPEFDGEPVMIYEPGPDEPPVPGDDEPGEVAEPGGNEYDSEYDSLWNGEEEDASPRKYYVGEVEVRVVAERVQYIDSHGKLVTETLRDYTKRKILGAYATLEDFLKVWTSAERKAVIVEELESKGLLLEVLEEEIGRDLDAFDLICHVVYGQPPLTRRERAEGVRKRDVFTKYGPEAREVLDALLDKYSETGIGPIEKMDVLKVDPFPKIGTPVEIVRRFGGKKKYLEALGEIESALYVA